MAITMTAPILITDYYTETSGTESATSIVLTVSNFNSYPDGSQILYRNITANQSTFDQATEMYSDKGFRVVCMLRTSASWIFEQGTTFEVKISSGEDESQTSQYSVEHENPPATSTIQITCATTGADIRYTLDGTDPTKESAQYTAPFEAAQDATIKARAFKDNLVSSDIAELTIEAPLPKLSMPELKQESNLVYLTNGDAYPSDAILYYMQGEDGGWVQHGTISDMESMQWIITMISEDLTPVKVQIRCEGYQDSDIASIEYEEVPPPLKLWDRLSDGSVVCYDRGEQYGSYVLQDGEAVKVDSGSDWRYMICEEYDLNHYETGLGTGGVEETYSGKQWGFYGTSTGVTDTAIGTGKNNTDQLISQNNNNSDTLWYYVNQHRTNTGKPWHVPSKDELNVLYENKDTISNFTINLSGYEYYWSSSESASSNAWYQRFSSGAQNRSNKYGTSVRVRCVRYI